MANRRDLALALAGTFGKYVRTQRRLQERSQSEVADKLGVAHSAYCGWEKGRCLPTLFVFLNLVRELDLDVDAVYALLDQAAAGEAAA